MQKFMLDGHAFMAENCVDGVLINPVEPKRFDDTPNESRPKSHRPWWNMPFIRTFSVEEWERIYAERMDEYAEGQRAYWAEKGRNEWMKAYPSGVRFEVRCLDGGAWDRSTCWAMVASLDEALTVAKSR